MAVVDRLSRTNGGRLPRAGRRRAVSQRSIEGIGARREGGRGPAASATTDDARRRAGALAGPGRYASTRANFCSDRISRGGTSREPVAVHATSDT